MRSLPRSYPPGKPEASMFHLFLAALLAVPHTHVSSSHTRVYYIAADELVWNYAPLGHNGITGTPFNP
ncbi:MAG: hypothetical protein H0W63_08235, partial [Gemmatimonadaceae bacterium]|nr:hypothetical protein [Gemmatimonadaceae bacterium]